jgi:DNA repair protein RadC
LGKISQPTKESMKNTNTNARSKRKSAYYSRLGQFRVARVNEQSSLSHLLDSPEAIVHAWRSEIETVPWFDPAKEHFVVFVLNNRLALVGWNLVSIGSPTEAFCAPCEVFRPAVVASGQYIAVAHNRPSNHTSPSRRDIRVTDRLSDAGGILGIKLVDHVIVGAHGHYSFKEIGLI